MAFLKNMFGKKTGSAAPAPEEECITCPSCGATYHTGRLLSSILIKSPDLAELENWSTRVACRSCGNPIEVTGSYQKVLCQPGPGS